MFALFPCESFTQNESKKYPKGWRTAPLRPKQRQASPKEGVLMQLEWQSQSGLHLEEGPFS